MADGHDTPHSSHWLSALSQMLPNIYAGIVMQRSAETGPRIAAGTQLLVVAQVDDPWVIAKFKETQLRKMRPGQRVNVKIDPLDETFKGTVGSMPTSTGEGASVLPAENATGHLVKVIQRLPVRIRLEKGQQSLEKVRPGMSAEPKVILDQGRRLAGFELG